MIKTHKNNGFSFIELVVVIAILAVLAAILAPLLFTYTENSRMQKDFSTMDELSNAIQLSLSDATVFDEVYEYAIPNNYMTYTDSSGNYAQQIVDAEYWAPDGCANGVTITFNPEDDGTYDLSKGIVNDMTYGNGSVGEKRTAEGDLKQCYFEEMGNQLFYSSVKQSVGTTLQNTSATYKNSSYTVFIRFYVVDGTRKVDISGAFNGTNLSPDCPAAIVEGTENYTPESKPTTTRPASQGTAEFTSSDLSGGGSVNGTNGRPSYKPCEHPSFEKFDDIYHQCSVSDCKKQFEHIYPETGLTAKCIDCEYVKNHTCSYVNCVCTQCGKTDPNHVHIYDSNGICTGCGHEKQMSLIPVGGVYTINGGETLVGNGTDVYFPMNTKDYDIYTYGDYEYVFNKYWYGYDNLWHQSTSLNGWGVRAIDTTKSLYGEILSSVNEKAVVTLYSTFYNCSSLTSAPEIPNSVNNMSWTFYGCKLLTTSPEIPNGVRQMFGTFQNCTALTTVPEIPNSVVNMGQTFYYCSSLKGDITINANTTSYNACFAGCAKDAAHTIRLLGNSKTLAQLRTTGYQEGKYIYAIRYPSDELIPVGGVYKLSNNTFMGNNVTELVGNGINVYFPDGVVKTDIYRYGDYEYCFNQRWNGVGWDVDHSQYGWGARVLDKGKTSYQKLLNSINGQSLYSISGTFSGCKSLTRAPEIPNGVRTMNSTFAGCSALDTAPEIPNSVTDMRYAFNNCTLLKTSPVLPSNLYIMDGLFYGCPALTTAPIIPNSVTHMSRAFVNCTALATVSEIPRNVTSMEYAFDGCTALKGEIVINANPTSYYYGCFQKCAQDEEHTIILKGNSTKLSELKKTGYNNGQYIQTCHSGGTATCTQKAVCSVCGQEYGNLKQHTYQNHVCTVCGKNSLDAYSMKLTEPGQVTVTVSSNNYDYYSSNKPQYAKIITFIPSETASYTITSSCGGDSYGRLYDENMTSLAYNDDSNGNGDFKITYNCTAGELYYIAVGMYSSTSSYSIKVTITKN